MSSTAFKPARRPESRDRQDAVGTYLDEIGRIALLSREEEIALARQVQRYMQLLKTKEQAEQKQGPAPLSEARWADLAGISSLELRQICADGLAARRQLIEANLRLVVTIAKKYHKSGIHFLDLVQEGNLGLKRAVEKFDPTLGWRFATYAFWWIRQSIARAIGTQAGPIRLPANVAEKLQRVRRVERTLALRLDRPPKLTELAGALQMAPVHLQQLLTSAPRICSLESQVGSEGDLSLADLLVASGPGPLELAHQETLGGLLREVLKKLPAREERIVRLRYGLEDGRIYTQGEVAQLLGMSRSRVCQIESRAIRRLREPHNSASLRSYLQP
ncbi:sigma-70 family RNA polymerase sigma factor [Gloeobacter kilaueensis]|uniref:RNA polymerase sigma factor SigC n=1 Tax=Gloeobacter kilaueensis (strain ATCC BAA-2537 / CCAP 1431/1 / ULC 316 / JS1) TaxID=1183438 RepID=U5QJQ1_GLOK1|nr:sigma-70 family RNA polymerase sigma factor [Gloeobacter kilaueensis]AGY59156.1 RNA polymerase sigma factor SigC [Gloeobacter kilaueensis JS1]